MLIKMKNFIKQFKNKKYNQGFTLVELMVALTLFVFVVLAAVSSLYTVNNSAKRVAAMRAVLDNLSFAVESMSRNIRTGIDIVCEGTQNNSGDPNCRYEEWRGSNRIMLHSTLLQNSTGQGQDVEYIYEDETIYKRTNDGSGWTEQVALTAPEVIITNAVFFVDGADPGDRGQPRVVILLRGEARAGVNNVSPFSIQTMVSQRSME